MKTEKTERSSGILMPVFSLPGKYGIGTLGSEAYDFVDFLRKAGQRYWQVLPVCQTTYGDSPYQSPSAFAGNPLFIDPEFLYQEGLLNKDDLKEEKEGWNESRIDYVSLSEKRFKLLKKAFDHFKDRKNLKLFARKNSWVNRYALFMSIKDSFHKTPWTKWPASLRKHDKKALLKEEARLKDEIDFYIFIQLKFFDEWNRLKKYANLHGVSIIGDIPFYVALDSVDVWENQSLFKLKANGEAKFVAGTPPDYFSKTGQLWGNPVYDWKTMKEDGYLWWMSRIKASLRFYDSLRIDHFRGIESYYEIPGCDKTAENGKWKKGPGTDFIDTLKKTVKNADIIAEDLGFLTPKVMKLLNYSTFPGMKILEFAFDSGPLNPYLPHKYPENCVVYTGTHDNDTALGWLKKADRKTLEFAGKYLGLPEEYLDFISKNHLTSESLLNEKKVCEFCVLNLIRAAFMSKAKRAIIPMQDWLFMDNDARINTPSTIGNNWNFRLKKSYFTKELAGRIKNMTEIFGRA